MKESFNNIIIKKMIKKMNLIINSDNNNNDNNDNILDFIFQKNKDNNDLYRK